MFHLRKNTQENEIQSQTALAQKQEAEKALHEGMVTIRDIIAPAALEIDFDHIRLGKFYVKSFFIFTYPRYVYTDWLSPIINFDITMSTSIFIYPQESREYMRKLRTKASQVESLYAEQREKGQVRDPMLEMAYKDIEELRDKLQAGTEKLFKLSIYFTLYAESKEELEDHTKRLESALGGQLVFTKSANLQQEQCFNSTLPFGKDEMMITRNMDTASLSTVFPFVSSTLSNNNGILYGVNMHNNTLVLFDRFDLENANSVAFAKSGSGKSYAVKLEALRSLMFGTEMIIIDPENEYELLCDAVGGTYIDVSLNSEKRVNPFDLPRGKIQTEEEGEEILRSNIIMLHGLLKIMFGTISPQEDSVLDKALVESYTSKGITTDPGTHSLQPPTMEDLQKILFSIPGGENMAAKLKKYTEGSFSGLFNQPSNVNLNNKFIVFNIQNLEDELRPVAMYSILNFIWNRVKSERRRRILIVEEAWIMMKHNDSAQFLYSIAKRARKYYLGLTVISQDVEDFLSSDYGKAIVNNSSLTLLLKQHPATIDLVANVFHLTQAEKYFLLNAEVGTGLFFAGQNHIGIEIIRSYQEDMLITTNPEQLNQMGV